jgi:biopolymer transport protein ExbD
MGGGASDDDEIISAINVTPLVDVVLVLLIILMVTASYIVSKSIPMDLPQASQSEGTPPRTITVSINAEGQLFIDADPVDRNELRRRVRAYREGNEEARAVIAADGSVTHAQVVRIIDLLRQERVTRFAISVSPEDLDRQEH